MKRMQPSFPVLFSIVSILVLPQQLKALENTPPPSYVLDSTLTFNINEVNTLKTYYLYDVYGNTCSIESYTYSENEHRYNGLSKKVRAFNASGQQILDESYAWNTTTKKWVPTSKYEYVFEGINNTQTVYFNWSTQNNAWIEGRKYVYQYNGNGENTLEVQLVWNGTLSSWENELKKTKTYDDYGTLTTDECFSWNKATSEWLQLWGNRYTSTYNANGNQTSFISETWNGSTTNWDYVSKTESTFDAQNRITKMETFSRVDGNWQVDSRELREYDQRGNTTKFESYIYSTYDNKFIGSTYYTCEYDAYNNKTLNLAYSWDYSTNKWVYSQKNIQRFTNDGKLLGAEDYYWDTSLNEWVGSYKNTVIYEDDKQTATSMCFQWNSTTKDWENSSPKCISVYNDKGQIVTYESINWNSSTKTWTNYSKELTTYYENGIIQSVEKQYWYKDQYQPLTKTANTYDAYGNLIVEESFIWNNSTKQFRCDKRVQYFYSAFVTGMDNIRHPAATFDVRSVDGMIIINFASTSQLSVVRIFDANGRLVNIVSGLNGTEQQVKTAKSGIYLVTDGLTTVKIKHK